LYKQSRLRSVVRPSAGRSSRRALGRRDRRRLLSAATSRGLKYTPSHRAPGPFTPSSACGRGCAPGRSTTCGRAETLSTRRLSRYKRRESVCSFVALWSLIGRRLRTFAAPACLPACLLAVSACCARSLARSRHTHTHTQPYRT
jgi:hypothetical protein